LLGDPSTPVPGEPYLLCSSYAGNIGLHLIAHNDNYGAKTTRSNNIFLYQQIGEELTSVNDVLDVYPSGNIVSMSICALGNMLAITHKVTAGGAPTLLTYYREGNTFKQFSVLSSQADPQINQVYVSRDKQYIAVTGYTHSTTKFGWYRYNGTNYDLKPSPSTMPDAEGSRVYISPLNNYFVVCMEDKPDDNVFIYRRVGGTLIKLNFVSHLGMPSAVQISNDEKHLILGYSIGSGQEVLVYHIDGETFTQMVDSNASGLSLAFVSNLCLWP
jgi:6-phosphogluconolactonase (cycloisomerase 2 family)